MAVSIKPSDAVPEPKCENDPADDPRSSIEALGPHNTIIDQVTNFIRRFVLLKEPAFYRLIALWVVATYFVESFDYAPYLFFHSPERQSGKTRVLEVLEQLVCDSSGIMLSPTEAVLFRTAKGTTQLLDEVDSWENREQLQSVLNAGNQKSGNVTRMQQNLKGGYTPVRFPVFAFRALAGIGVGILDGTTRDRTFPIQMVRQTNPERREKFRLRHLKAEIDVLLSDIINWWLENKDAVSEAYDKVNLPYLEPFQDRTMDITEPLAVILELAYKNNPRLDKVRSDFVRAISISREEEQEESKDHLILRVLLVAAEGENPLIGNATELRDNCSDLPRELTYYDISATLRKYGFKTKSIRKDGTSKYRYHIG